MQSASRQIESLQSRPHSSLPRLLARRRRRAYSKPIGKHNAAVFAELDDWLRWHSKPLLLDAGCGTGSGSAALACRYPHCAIVGIDKSAHRLERAPMATTGANCRLARADLTDIWRLAVAAGWQPIHHYLLYPNPWPKPRHLARRWHAHPVLPWILALGGTLELRTNWAVYAREFARSLTLALRRPIAPTPFVPDEPLTPFEHKYRDSGHNLYRCRVIISEPERRHWSMTTRKAVI